MQVGRLQDVNEIITDRSLPTEEQAFLRTLPLKLTLVAP
jgi:DeoR/GlpR family transcriptional regulator of sugar metabolism